MEIREYLKKYRLIADGAMGTYYACLGEDDRLISEMANIISPEKIVSIHKEYIAAGARLIRTNTFAANRGILEMTPEKQEEIFRSAVHIAKKAVKESALKEETVFIAGDIGPIPVNGDTSEEQALKEYKKMCDIFLEEGVSAILFETFSEIGMLSEVVRYIRSKSDIFIMVNFCINKNGYTSMGISAKRLMEDVEKMPEIDGVGLNCGIGSGHMGQIIRKLELPKNKYFTVMPNAGYPEQLSNRMVFMNNTEYFVENMMEISKYGISIVGGCCGTTPDYIRKLKEKISLHPVLSAMSIETGEKEEKPEQEVKYSDFYQKILDGKKVVLVELDPPYDAEYEKLIEHAQYLKKRNVDIITMADSPGGRSRADSILMSIKIAREVGIDVMPHVSCRDRNMISMRSTLLGAYINDIRNLLLVTGDPIPSVNRGSVTGVFDYNSVKLMNFVKEMNQEHFRKEPLIYGGALNYAGNLEPIITKVNRKMEQGASYFLTQPIYSGEDIERIHEIKRRTGARILCGIMPFTSYRNANFVKNEIAGIHVPDEILNRYHPDMSREEAEITGAAIASEIIDKLHMFAEGYYFMLPFNRVSFMDKIIIK